MCSQHVRVYYADQLSTGLGELVSQNTGLVVIDESEAPLDAVRGATLEETDCVVAVIDPTSADRLLPRLSTELVATPLIAVVPESLPTIDVIEAGATDAIERSTVEQRPSVLVDRVIAAAYRTDRIETSEGLPTDSASEVGSAPDDQLTGYGAHSESTVPSSITGGSTATASDHGQTDIDTESVCHGVFKAIVGAEDRTTFLRAVLDAFVTADCIVDAWYGRYDLIDGTVQPTLTRGLNIRDFDPSDKPGGDPLVAAIEQRHPQRFGGNGSSEDASASSQFLEDDDRSLAPYAVVPINDGTAIHGLCVLYTTRPRSPSRSELEFYGIVGRAAGVVATALQRQQAVAGGDELELELEHPEADTFLSQLSVDGGHAAIESYSTEEDGSVSMYTRTDADREYVFDLAADAAEVESISVIASTDETLLARVDTVPGANFFEVADTYGITLYSATAQDGASRLIVGAPSNADVREYLNVLSEAIGEIDLVAIREHSTATPIGTSTHEALDGRLTDRQYEVLLTAYHGGFYGWPREQTSEELADSLGISQPTFAQHLRAAEGTAFELLLDGNRTLERT